MGEDLLRFAVRSKSDASEAEDHHRPSGCFGDGTRVPESSLEICLLQRSLAATEGGGVSK